MVVWVCAYAYSCARVVVISRFVLIREGEVEIGMGRIEFVQPQHYCARIVQNLPHLIPG